MYLDISLGYKETTSKSLIFQKIRKEQKELFKNAKKDFFTFFSLAFNLLFINAFVAFKFSFFFQFIKFALQYIIVCKYFINLINCCIV